MSNAAKKCLTKGRKHFIIGVTVMNETDALAVLQTERKARTRLKGFPRK